VATKRHKSAVVTQSSNTKVYTFFKSIAPDKTDMAIALQKGTFAFRTKLKFTCSGTKVEALIKHVISPWAYEEVTN
jgi:hypothetical protein